MDRNMRAKRCATCIRSEMSASRVDSPRDLRDLTSPMPQSDLRPQPLSRLQLPRYPPPMVSNSEFRRLRKVSFPRIEQRVVLFTLPHRQVVSVTTTVHVPVTLPQQLTTALHLENSTFYTTRSRLGTAAPRRPRPGPSCFWWLLA